jgi:hypothetical protein
MSDTRTAEGAENPAPVDQKSAATSGTTPAPAGKETPKADEELDDDGDWIANSSLSDNQKKFMRRALTQNKNRADELKKIKAKLTEKEKAEAEAQRKIDEEQGNWKKIAEENAAALAAKDEKILRAEVRALAIKEGIIDPKIIDRFPLDGVSMDKEGEIVGVEKFVKDLKKNSAYLFGSPEQKSPEGTTTTTPAPTPSSNPKSKSALEMTDEEYRKAKAEWLSGEKTVGKSDKK